MTQALQLLILDDSAQDLEIFRLVALHLDCQSFITQSYQEAADFCVNNKVDILISDLNVGEDSGFELMQLALSSPNSSKMRRIIYTTASPAPNYDKLKQLDIVGWIVKPAEYESLLSTLQDILRDIASSLDC